VDKPPSDAGTSEEPEKEKDIMGLTRIKADSSSFEGTDCTASNEGIEVEAIEFDKVNYKKNDGIPKRLLLFILAFVVILAASAGAGFAVLNSKKKGSSTIALSSEDGSQSSNTTENETDASQSDISESEQTIDTADATESSNSLPTVAPSARQTEVATEEDSDWGSSSDSIADAGESLWSDALDEAAEEESSAEVAPGSNNIITSSSATTTTTTTSSESSETDSLWSDPVCSNDDLAVSSACASASSISKASFCFASKRDGDWYWVRSASEDGTSPAYDSWDYIDETQGELSILDLNEGNYIISLVRDSMEPYDEIVSHEFTVPECQ